VCRWVAVGVPVSGCRCVRVSTFAMFLNIIIYIMPYEATQLPYLQFRVIRNNNMAHARIFEVGRRGLELTQVQWNCVGYIMSDKCTVFVTVMVIFLEHKVTNRRSFYQFDDGNCRTTLLMLWHDYVISYKYRYKFL